ncbi:MAG: hypothetical protein IJQ08_09690 [Synergistaceae bacterium]|nr:hypothetical protein [Synergistaceae bacterium]
MRKILAVMIVLLTTSGTSYGAVSEDMSVYVRRDVFEVYMQNMNANMGRILDELKEQRKAINDLSDRVSNLSDRVSNLSGRVDGLDKRLDSVNSRIDDLRNGIYLWLAAIGILIAWPKVRDKLPKWGNSVPSLTLEDVNRLLDEKLANRPQA